MFDIVQADKPISNELEKEIKKDGVIIYEKAWKLFKLSFRIKEKLNEAEITW